jgi:dihydroneopterin aldolase
VDVVSIRELRVPCIVGVYPHERKREQDLFLDVDLWMDLAPAAQSDHLSDAVDYTHVAEDLTAFIQAERFQLIEALAYRACDRLLQREASVRRCRLTIRKPGALPNAQYAAVTVERERAA